MSNFWVYLHKFPLFQRIDRINGLCVFAGKLQIMRAKLAKIAKKLTIKMTHPRKKLGKSFSYMEICTNFLRNEEQLQQLARQDRVLILSRGHAGIFLEHL